MNQELTLLDNSIIAKPIVTEFIVTKYAGAARKPTKYFGTAKKLTKHTAGMARNRTKDIASVARNTINISMISVASFNHLV